MTTDPQYLTNEKFAELTKELGFLKAERRKEVAEHLEYAKKLGDLSENAEYHQAREEQAEVEDRIRYLEDLLKSARITASSGSDAVAVGSTVRLEQEGAGEKRSLLFTIVGSEEADMSQGKISNLSPIGAAVIGHKKGDKVKVQTPKGVSSYLIAAIK